jgi:Ca-activated chloride channel homolog
MNRRTVLSALAATSAGSFSLFGSAQPDFTLRSDVRLVLLDVAVRDRKGRLVSGLKRNDFAVFENGREQQITAFSHGDLPITVGLLVDQSFSMKPKQTEVLAAAEVFIQNSNPLDETFVLQFNDRVTRALPQGVMFSSDGRQLRSALYRGNPQGRTALNDAIAQGLTQLRLGRREKKALLLISDGGDNASEHTRRQVVAMAERSSATIYAIGIYDDGDPDRDPGFLKTLCSLSGGEAFFPTKPEGTGAVCRRIAADIRSRYTIGYIPAGDGGNTLRHIRVRAAAPQTGNLTAVTRTSYLYDDTGKQE